MENKIDLTTFKKAYEAMVAKNDMSWNTYFGHYRPSQIRDYTPEEIEQIINNGSLTEMQRLSRNYYDKDGFYKRILIYYATILMYYGILVPNPGPGQKLSNSNNKKRYLSALSFVDKINLPELLTRISLKALIDGCYYGILQTLNKNDLVIIDLPSGYCTSRFKDLHGNDIIEFNVSYFDNIISDQIREKVLKSYPKEVYNHYRKWKNGKIETSWVILPVEISVCFTIFDDMRPPFLSVIPATIQYDDAVDTERERELEEIRKIIVQKIPHLNDGQLLFEPDEAVEMHQGAVGMMSKNKNLSILTTYADVDAIISKTSADTVSNSLEKMQQNIYSNAGASPLLFAPTGVQALLVSITNDMSFMMILGNKYSRFITWIVNQLFSTPSLTFTWQLLTVSYYNQKDFIDESLKLAQSGYSFLLPSIASGVSQRSLTSIKELENDVLDLGSVLIPLSSSYTQSTGEVGRPKKDLEDKAQKTIQNEDAINNQGGSE